MKFLRLKAHHAFSYSYLVILLCAGCSSSRIEQVTIETPPKILVSDYGQGNQIPLKVELFISDELRAAYWPRKGFAATPSYRLVLGDVLVYNAENVARQVFTGVVVTGGSEGPGQTGLPGVLVPRVVTIEQYTGSFSYGVLTVFLEWTLKDAKGNIVWIDTIKGEGRTSWSLEPTTQQRSVTMLNDLFHKSFTALSSSRAIREFAAKQQKQLLNQP